MPSTRWLLVLVAVCALGTFAIAHWADPLGQTSVCSLGVVGVRPGDCSTDWPGRPWFVLEVFLGGLLTLAAGWLLIRAVARGARGSRVTAERHTS